MLEWTYYLFPSLLLAPKSKIQVMYPIGGLTDCDVFYYLQCFHHISGVSSNLSSSYPICGLKHSLLSFYKNIQLWLINIFFSSAQYTASSPIGVTSSTAPHLLSLSLCLPFFEDSYRKCPLTSSDLWIKMYQFLKTPFPVLYSSWLL